MDRGTFFEKAFKFAAAKGMSLVADNPVVNALESLAEEPVTEEEPQKKPRIERPPGALEDDQLFQQRCTGCDNCMAACPHNVVMIEDLEKRYPVIYSDVDPCLMCSDFPCIQSCQSGALIALAPQLLSEGAEASK